MDVDILNFKSKLSKTALYDLEIKSITEEIEYLHRVILPILADKNNPKVKEIRKLAAEVEAKRRAEIRKIEEQKKAIEAIKAAIEQTSNEVEKEILTLRYIKGEKWEKIADSIQYSLRRTMSIHKKALEQLKERLSQGKGQ